MFLEDTIAMKIKFSRNKKAWTQAEFAKKLNTSRTTVVNWETGYSKPPQKQIDNICEVLGIEKSWLLDEDDDFFYGDSEEKIADQTKSEFGMKLRLLRKAHKMTLDDVAEHLSVGRTGYVRYEKGTAEPSLDSLRTLSKMFNVSIDSLLSNMDESHSEVVENIDDWIVEIVMTEGKKKEALKNIWNEIKKI